MYPLSRLFARKPKRNRTRRSSALNFCKLEDRVLLAVTDLRFATYNALNFGSSSADRQDEFEIVFNDLNADVVVMQEITSEVGADLLLNAINGGSQRYSRANFVNGTDSDHILFYDSSKVDLISQDYIPTSLREFGEYTLSVDGTEFNVYSAHLKASTGSSNEQRRLDEVTVLRNHLETLPSDMEFIFAGDMNIYGSSEPAYQKLIANESNNDGRLEDLLPSNLIGEWHNNSAFASVHTQSPRTTQFGGGATGGMDDRFDMIFGNFGINDGFGIEYVTDSYFALGNDGQHFNQSILAGSNSSASPAVIQALHDASDHLPVVADFQVITSGGNSSGVAVVQSDGSTSVSEGGSTDTYQVVLDSVPTSNVVVSVTPNAQVDLGNGAGIPTSLTFTPSNALTPQTIIVSAFDDAVIEGPHTGFIQHSVSSSDTGYNGLIVSDIVVSIADNDSFASSFLLNEVYVNNPGSDSNLEYIEILASPSTPLTDVWLLEIEGDGTGAGTIDNAQNLSSLTTGSNGLVLLGQNYANNGTPWGSQVDAATTVANLTGGSIENGTVTFLLVEGFSGSNGTDLDTDNDGLFDSAPWTSIYDSVGWKDNGSSDRVYSAATLSQSGTPDAATRIANDDRAETLAAWFNGDIIGSTNSTTYDNGSSNIPQNAVITPGDTNFGDLNPTAGIFIAQSGGSTSLAEGGVSDSWTVVLDTVPTSNVTVTIDPDVEVDLGAGAGLPIQLVFTPSNALTPKTVVAIATDDLVAESSHSGLITLSVTSADSNYSGLSIPNINADITDNDLAGVSIVQTGGSTDVTEGGNSDTYTVVLDSVPTANVTVTVDPDGQASIGSGTGNPVTLTFTPSNALTPQTVTVAANDDSVIEGQHSSTIAHSVSSSDSFYTGLSLGLVVATITDNDFEPPGITVTQTGGSTSVSEAGSTDSYSVVLDAPPTSNVVVTVNPGGEIDLSNGPGASVDLVFTPGNFLSPQTVTVSAVDDAIFEGNHSDLITHTASSFDGDYDGLVLSNISVAITDDDSVGIVLSQSGGSTTVTEGGNNDSYTLVLESQPTSNVTVAVDPDSQIDLGAGAGNSIQVVFTSNNALTPQTVTVVAVDDTAVEGSHSGLITHSITSSDANYNGLSVPGVNATITDNDAVASSFLLNEVYVNNPGTDSNFEYVEILASPSAPLTDVWLLEIEGDGAGSGTIDNAQNLSALTSGSNGLLLLGQNYATNGTPWGSQVDGATTVANLTGGSIENGTVTFLLVEGFSGSNGTDLDTNNDGLFDSTPWTSIYDSVGWKDNGSSDRVYSAASLGQSGTPDAATRITNDYRVETLAAWFNGDITGSTSSTTYDNGSSNLPVSAVITPGDMNFGDTGPAAGISIAQSGGNTSLAEGGSSDSWTVVLDSVPTSNVTVTIDPDGEIDLGAGAGVPVQVAFTPSNALSPQAVVAFAADDLVAEGSHSGLITLSVTSADSDYSGLSVPNINASIADNDSAGVSIFQTNGSTDVTEGGSSDIYTVVLDSVPTANVTVTVDPDGQASIGSGTGNPVTLTFTPSNALTPQTVTVAANDDSVIEGQHSSTIAHSVSSSDSFYNGLNPDSVVATITDNEWPLGDVNQDGVVNFLDIAPFTTILQTGGFQDEADINRDGVVNFLDISFFIDLLSQ